MSVPGVGPIISSAVVAAIGTGAGFKQGRDFRGLAWAGTEAGVDRRPHHPGQDLEARQQIPKDPVRAGRAHRPGPSTARSQARPVRWTNGLPGATMRLGAMMAHRGRSASQPWMRADPHDGPELEAPHQGRIHRCSSHVRQSANIILRRTAGPYIMALLRRKRLVRLRAQEPTFVEGPEGGKVDPFRNFRLPKTTSLRDMLFYRRLGRGIPYFLEVQRAELPRDTGKCMS